MVKDIFKGLVGSPINVSWSSSFFLAETVIWEIISPIHVEKSKYRATCTPGRDLTQALSPHHNPAPQLLLLLFSHYPGGKQGKEEFGNLPKPPSLVDAGLGSECRQTDQCLNHLLLNRPAELAPWRLEAAIRNNPWQSSTATPCFCFRSKGKR